MHAVVFTKPDCKYCLKVKRLLLDFGYSIDSFDITEPSIGQIYQCIGWKTVPQVFINGVHIGGFEETYKHLTGQDYQS